MTKELNLIASSQKVENKKIKTKPIDSIVFRMDDFLPNGNARETSSNGLAVVGENGNAKAESTNGIAIAGNNGTAQGGQWGASFAGEEGHAIAGANAVAYAGKGGVAEGGDGAVAIVLMNLHGKERAKVRDNGIGFCRRGGIAEVGKNSLAIGFDKTKASADNGSLIVLRYTDSNGIQRFHIGVVGDGDIKVTKGLQARTFYKLDANHEFTKV
ncbi:MAG: hypothetical protein R2681_11900 [Pyrinomonadaceae bacterium]